MLLRLSMERETRLLEDSVLLERHLFNIRNKQLQCIPQLPFKESCVNVHVPVMNHRHYIYGISRHNARLRGQQCTSCLNEYKPLLCHCLFYFMELLFSNETCFFYLFLFKRWRYELFIRNTKCIVQRMTRLWLNQWHIINAYYLLQAITGIILPD